MATGKLINYNSWQPEETWDVGKCLLPGDMWTNGQGTGYGIEFYLVNPKPITSLVSKTITINSCIFEEIRTGNGAVLQAHNLSTWGVCTETWMPSGFLNGGRLIAFYFKHTARWPGASSDNATLFGRTTSLSLTFH